LAEAVRHLNQTCVRLVEGQFLDLQFETVETISLSQYSRMIARKSAALIECACALGALTAGADADTIAGCADFGHRLGLGFQAQDDVLGVWGDPAVTGKPVYADIRSRKKSLPMVLALELADGNARKRLEHLVAPARRLGEPEIHEILSIMAALGVRERAEEIATEHFVAAEAALRRALPPGRNGELRAVCARLRARVA
jgi:geranylgeranyl diphosphate synthase type I